MVFSRPGRADITATRLAMKIASSMSCVTKSTVLRSASQMPSRSSCMSARLVVERAERLVEQQDLRIVGESACQRRALLHAAGAASDSGSRTPSIPP